MPNIWLNKQICETGLYLMGIIELHELITRALADGKHVVYDYSEDELHLYCDWAHVDKAIVDGNILILELINSCDGWEISMQSNDQSAVDDFIARVAIYDELYKPRNVVLGAGKRVIKDTSSEYPLSLTEAVGVYKAHNTGVKIDGWKTRYIYETNDGMRFIE